MKKKIFGGIAVLAFAAIVSLNVKMNANDNETGNLALANVEALASGETYSTPCNTTGSKCTYDCEVGGQTQQCTIYGYDKK